MFLPTASVSTAPPELELPAELEAMSFMGERRESEDKDI